MIYDEKILKNGLCTAIPTAEMTRREWLEARRRGIGGSDAGAVLGMNRYSSPLSVYLSKKGFGNNGEKESPALRWGKMAENAIRDGIARDMGLLIEEAPVMFPRRTDPTTGRTVRIPFNRRRRLLCGTNSRRKRILMKRTVFPTT